jgi:hypothetical protein
VHLSVVDLLPKKGKTLVTCGACGKASQVAGRTRIGGGVAGMLGSLVAVALTVGTSQRLCVAAGLLTYLVVGYLASRLMLRLDPPELAD